MKIGKISIKVLFVDLIPNFPNQLYKNSMGDSKENYLWDLGSRKFTEI